MFIRIENIYFSRFVTLQYGRVGLKTIDIKWHRDNKILVQESIHEIKWCGKQMAALVLIWFSMFTQISWKVGPTVTYSTSRRVVVSSPFFTTNIIYVSWNNLYKIGFPQSQLARLTKGGNNYIAMHETIWHLLLICWHYHNFPCNYVIICCGIECILIGSISGEYTALTITS